MKKLLLTFMAFAMIIVLAGCGSGKNIPYFQNIDTISLAASRGLYDAHIMPKDELTISVYTVNKEAAEPFNPTNTNQGGGSQTNSNAYLVDNDGCISFPVIGTIHVVGLTNRECENLIKSKIQPYLAKTENPVVKVRLSSYHVTVIGEVGGSAIIPVTTEKMSIVEALASAGDLGIYGKRNNIMLIREDATGEKHEVRLNMNDANIINSPYYYLQQNDIIYVEPNRAKTANSAIGQSTTLWFSLIGIVTSVASLLTNVLR